MAGEVATEDLAEGSKSIGLRCSSVRSSRVCSYFFNTVELEMFCQILQSQKDSRLIVCTATLKATISSPQKLKRIREESFIHFKAYSMLIWRMVASSAWFLLISFRDLAKPAEADHHAKRSLMINSVARICMLGQIENDKHMDFPFKNDKQQNC